MALLAALILVHLSLFTVRGEQEGTCYSMLDYDEKFLQTLERINNKVDALHNQISEFQNYYDTAEELRNLQLHTDMQKVLNTVDEVKANVTSKKNSISLQFENLLNRYGKCLQYALWF